MSLASAAASSSLGVGLLVAAFMLAALSFAVGVRYGQRSLRCGAHGRACNRCPECP